MADAVAIDGAPVRLVDGGALDPLVGPQCSLAVLADVSVGLMYAVIKPLGSIVTTQPVGPDVPGVTAGPGFELFYSVDYLLPHREAAWVLMEERLRDAALFAVRCGELCTLALMEPLARVARSLEKYADQLDAAR